MTAHSRGRGGMAIPQFKRHRQSAGGKMVVRFIKRACAGSKDLCDASCRRCPT